MGGYQLFRQFADGRILGTFRIAGKCLKAIQRGIGKGHNTVLF